VKTNMTMRMLIDATHAEETRVVILRGNRLESFDFESASRRQLKGNIYLAKVTRVEPSLQAAFVDYGGNRHGFLAFNEIHPDYYQIPIADRQALLAEEAQQVAEEAELEDAAASQSAAEKEDEGEGEAEAEADVVGGADSTMADALDEVPRPKARPKRSYKIQEVIKRRQILLVQVVKEERGNKGAALTTYLSLAGRYCVLMPNTARGGGISRKIVNQIARRKLKQIVSDLELPEGMGVIVRTAGMSRTKTEIRRDFEYLLRLWDEVRENTLKSTAPTLVYEEANLVKRAIRDHYSKDIDEILVEGEAGYRVAKEFMRSMQPSHSKKVQHYRGRIPLLHRYQVEQQLDQMHSNVVHLKSGGYIVLSPTEALVAIDVNSGRSTREHNIEETALKTNLEASDEIARQLRLRDLAGLIVIDYIDMAESKHSRQVERRLKECLKTDRARLQVGRISSFGLLEMSRQRMRPSLFEASMVACSTCSGSGFVRSTESTALHVLRAIEEEGIRGRADAITVKVPLAVALYVLNNKRAALREIEKRYDMHVMVLDDINLVPPEYQIEIDDARSEPTGPPEAVEEIAAESETEVETETETETEASVEVEAEEEARKGRRRRRRRKRADDDERVAPAKAEEPEDEDGHDEAEEERKLAAEAAPEATEEDGGRRRRRRGRRGGRRRRAASEATEVEAVGDETTVAAVAVPLAVEPAEALVEPEPADASEAPERTEALTEPKQAEAPAEPEPAEADEAPEPADVPAESQPVAVVRKPEPVEMPSPESETPPRPLAAAERQDEAGGEASAALVREPAEHVTASYSAGGDAPPVQVHNVGAGPKEQAEEAPKRRGWWQRKLG